MFYNNKELFEQIILRVSDESGIEAGIIEKDYYVTLFLKCIVKRQPDIIFKGGTSLSKCYKLIQRFSEDIDLSLNAKEKPTEGQRRQLKESIVSIIDGFGFTLTNSDTIKSRRDYNKYIIDYPSVFDSSYLKQHLIVETSVYISAYPYHRLKASSLIYDYLYKNGFTDIIEQYDLSPFELNVQSADRTLIDKVCAIGDYYLSGKITEHSRHIYDIYKLIEVVNLNDELKLLTKEVLSERKKHKTCLSAQENVDLKKMLYEIIEKDIYKSDYETITSALLFEKVDYADAIGAVYKIIERGIFDE